MAAAPKIRRKVGNKVRLPEPLPLGFGITDIFKKSWTVHDKIDSGGFGTIYLAASENQKISNSRDCDHVVKVEFHNSGGLYIEIHFYRCLAKPEHIAEWEQKKKLNYLGMSACHGLGSFEHNGVKCRFLVLQRYGTDILRKLRESANRFTVKTTFSIGIAVLNVLEYLHTKGYIHGDIKAANLLLGRKKGTENNVYLVDMGMASKYVIKDVHKNELPDPKKAHNGTIEFVSRDSHRGTPSTRRSDIESLGYNMLLWLSGTLPWLGELNNVKGVWKIKEECMKDVKKFVKLVFPSSDVPPGITEYLRYVQNLEFDETPDYDKLKQILATAIGTQGERYDGKLNFGKVSNVKIVDNSTSSCKENLVKKDNVKAPKMKRKREKTPIVLEPGIVPTPAMLALLNKN